MDYIGQFAIIHLVLHVLCICIAYWALNSLKLDQFFKKRLRYSSTSLSNVFSHLIGYSREQFFN